MAKILIQLMFIILLPSHLFATEPYGLKGDVLGVDLKYFKKRYHRRVQGHDEDLPYCSDYQPNQEMAFLLTKKWHHRAGIVNCRINFPCEEREEGGKLTVFGVAANKLIYHFIDQKLFMITLQFMPSSFNDMKNALIAKYGKPSSAENLVWDNEVSSIKLNEMPKKNYFSLIYQHKELSGIYDMRKSSSNADNLLVGAK